MTATYTYACEPDPGSAGTRLSLVVDCRVAGAWRLAGGLLRAAIRRTDAGQLDTLKRVIESREAHT